MSRVSELADKLHERTKYILTKLDEVWDDIGLDEDTREQRNQMFFEHVEELYNDMIEEAESNKTTLLEDIETIGRDLFKLRRDLRLDFSIDEYENTPLYITKQSMKSKLENYQKLYDEKLNEVKKLIANQKILCHALGKKPKEILTSPLPTKEEINEFQTYLEELSDIKFTREEEFLKLKSRIITIMDELKINPSLDFERKVVACEDSAFTVTEENMAQLRALHKSLENQLQETKIKIVELREQVSNLWERLEESHQVRSAFLEAYPGNSINTLIELKAELQRLEEKKKANIKLFVDKLRQELLNWWSKCYTSQDEQNEFMHFQSDCYTEDLLTLHEIQVEKIKSHYENNIAIYNMLTKRENLWGKMMDLEQRSNQPNRFKNRGGQLLNEEKERKTIAALLPKIESELIELVREYEKNNGKPFLVNGWSVEDLVNKAWEEHKEEKKLKLSVKKKLREQIPTPSKVLVQPTMSTTSKRKLFTPTFESSKKSRLEVIEKSKTSSKLLTSTSRAKSIDRRQRLEKIKKREHAKKVNDTNYEVFENGLESKSSCRSSLFPNRCLRSATKTVQPTNGTPRKPLLVVSNTPIKTPLRSGLRSKSPILMSTRLAAAPNNLPIII